MVTIDSVTRDIAERMLEAGRDGRTEEHAFLHNLYCKMLILCNSKETEQVNT